LIYPHDDSYKFYREGLIKRHITCSGRYLHNIWMKEYDKGKDPKYLDRYKRIFTSPLILGYNADKYKKFSPRKKIHSGVTPFLIKGKENLYLFYTTKKDNCIYYVSANSKNYWQNDAKILKLSKTNEKFKTDYDFSVVKKDDYFYICFVNTKGYISLLKVLININNDLEVVSYVSLENSNYKSKLGPAICVTPNNFFIAFVNNKDHIQIIKSTDIKNWEEITELDRKTKLKPAIVNFNNFIYVAWFDKETNLLKIIRSKQGVNPWKNEITFEYFARRGYSEIAGPSFFIDQNELYIVWNSCHNENLLKDENPLVDMYIYSKDGINWDIKRPILLYKNGVFSIPDKKNSTTPQLVRFNQKIFHLWQTEDKAVYCEIIDILQERKTRSYIPWIDYNEKPYPSGINLNHFGEIYGGEDNPLLHGGIAMATFAIEYMVAKNKTSLDYCELLLKYFETCEVKDNNGNPIGFFIRSCNINNPIFQAEEGETDFGIYIEKMASADEILGLVLGLFYFYKAIRNLKYKITLRDRIINMTNRLGQYLKNNGYLLLPPNPVNNNLSKNIHPRIHTGSYGLFFIEFALNEAFEFITNNRYKAQISDYRNASVRLLEIYKMKKIPAHDEKEMLLIIMYFWSLIDYIEPNKLSEWNEIFDDDSNNRLYTMKNLDKKTMEILAVACVLGFVVDGNLSVFVSNILGIIAQGLLTSILDDIKQPYTRYKLGLEVIRLIYQLKKYNNDKIQNIVNEITKYNFHTVMMLNHSLLFAIDDDDRNNKKDLIDIAKNYVKKQLGFLLPTYKKPVEDYYTATIYCGLLSRSKDEIYEKCILPVKGMWEELCAIETTEIRLLKDEFKVLKNDTFVKWHNSILPNLNLAKIGGNFCWEKAKSLSNKCCGLYICDSWIEGGASARMDFNFEHYKKATGLTKEKLFLLNEQGKDAFIECGGLDFLFPSILLKYWGIDNTKVKFDEVKFEPINVIVSSPFQHEEFENYFKQIICPGFYKNYLEKFGERKSDLVDLFSIVWNY